ncbi:MAG: heme o synthase [Limnochordales bacterium]
MATMAVSRSWKEVLGDHVAVTKPRIVILIALTTWGAMLVAAPGQSPASRIAFTLLGTALAVASAHTFNQCLERDLDALMKRTRKRPLVRGTMTPEHALRYAAVLAVASFAILTWKVNLLSALLAQAGLWFYVGVYTVLLKRRTPLNTVIGGIAGSIPPLIGWAAATGRLDLAALVLFAVMVLWQPPHFYALTLFLLDDYRNAGYPMLPVVRGPEVASRHIAWYTTGMVLLSLTVYYPLGISGPFYLATALVAGGIYMALAWAAVFRRTGTVQEWGKRLFRYSMLYLAVLFVAMVIDVIP